MGEKSPKKEKKDKSAKKEKKEKRKSDAGAAAAEEQPAAAVPTKTALAPIAKPLADDKLAKKVRGLHVGGTPLKLAFAAANSNTCNPLGRPAAACRPCPCPCMQPVCPSSHLLGFTLAHPWHPS